MVKRIVFVAAVGFIIPLTCMAQVQQGAAAHPVGKPDEILRAVGQHIQKGEACVSAGDVECARREFDSAIDEFLESEVDLRSDQRLLAGWRETIEKINRHELTPIAAGGKTFWRSQDYDGRPPQVQAVETLAEATGPLTPDIFQQRFGELRKRFEEKYGRVITLTGADHAEHRRLYGSGSAYDIRVRDLTREQVGYIIATGDALGLHIKDFSTWESVAAHNARSRMLGRPVDTLATGVHLHIDRMALSRKQSLVSVPAVMSRPSHMKRGKSR